MKSRDEIVIIMLQWMRLYTLGSRGSRELKTFLETRLIFSRVDQKLKNKEGKYMLIKREIGPESWAIEAIVEALCKGCGSGSLGRGRSFGIGYELAAIFLQSRLKGGHDFRHDRPRSRHDRASIVLQILQQLLSDDHGLIPRRMVCDRGLIAPQSRLDRAAIAARSDRDRGVPPRLVVAVRCSSGEGTVTIARSS